jgi:transposase
MARVIISNPKLLLIMDIQYFIGVDIAKSTLDWAVFNGKTIVFQTHSANLVAGIKTVLRLLKALPGWNTKQVVFCMEHTGLYNAHLLDFLHRLQLPIWLEGSLQIKRAGGLQRGKTDTIDAQRIAEYAFRFRDRVRLWQPPRPVIQQLAFLTGPPERCCSSAINSGIQSVG